MMNKRVFIAVDVSDEVRIRVADYIASLREGFPKIRAAWEKNEKLHLTLKFLGKIDDGKLNEIAKIISDATKHFAPFRLRVCDTGVFPSAKKARVLWLDVADENKSLAKINQVLEDECEKIGLARESRKYVPHLTIARIRESQNAENLIARHLETKFEPIEFEVSEIVIYESELQKNGSIYSVISKHKLLNA